MDETQFLLFKKLAEIIRQHEARIRELEEQVSGCVTNLSEDVEELDQLAKQLPGVHFPDPNCDRAAKFLRRGKPDPVPFPEDDYF